MCLYHVFERTCVFHKLSCSLGVIVSCLIFTTRSSFQWMSVRGNGAYIKLFLFRIQANKLVPVVTFSTELLYGTEYMPLSPRASRGVDDGRLGQSYSTHYLILDLVRPPTYDSPFSTPVTCRTEMLQRINLPYLLNSAIYMTPE